MNSIDILVGIFLLLGLVQGLKKGFLIELASLIGLFLGVLGAIYFSHIVSGFLESFVNWNEQSLHLAAFVITFLGIVILVSVLAKILTKTINFIALGLINKLLGGLFGVLKMGFIASLIFLFLNSFETEISFLEEEQKEASILYEPVSKLAPMVLPKLIKEFDSYLNEEV